MLIMQKNKKRRKGKERKKNKAEKNNKDICSDLDSTNNIEVTETISSFEELGLIGWLCNTVKEMSFRKPTPIQMKCIPKILKGHDVIGRAKTGSGKTAAFALPMLHILGNDPFGIFGLILTPTRELALQMADQFRAFGQPMGLKSTVVIGGLGNTDQAIALRQRPHIVLATPGRLAQHIRTGLNIYVENLQFLVLDEADRLFEEHFQEDLETIIRILPERQTLMFSATMTRKLVEYQKITLPNALYVEVDSATDLFVKTLDQKYLFIPQTVKECYIVYLLTKCPEFDDTNVIIFTSTCRGCELLTELLVGLQIPCVPLHSRINQQRRMASIGKFKMGLCKILVSTDVGSRGLDIPTVKLVVNYDVPRATEDYIHRVGRTARAGRGGMAITFVSQYDIEIYKEIELRIGKQLDKYEINEDHVLEDIKKVKTAYTLAKVHLRNWEKLWQLKRRQGQVKKRRRQKAKRGQ